MQETQYARRLDSTGRLVIPSRLREELGIDSGETYSFYTHEENGEVYLCIKCPKVESELQKAMKVLEKNGIKIQTV